MSAFYRRCVETLVFEGRVSTEKTQPTQKYTPKLNNSLMRKEDSAMDHIPGYIEGLPVLEALCERPNPESPETNVLVVAWCKRCKRLHQHGDRRLTASCPEEFMPRGAHCRDKWALPYACYQIHRTLLPRTHTQDGVTAPVLNVVGYQRNGSALVICPKCRKKHRHDELLEEEYTLVDGRCYPQYFVRQTGDV